MRKSKLDFREKNTTQFNPMVTCNYLEPTVFKMLDVIDHYTPYSLCNNKLISNREMNEKENNQLSATNITMKY